MTDDRAEFAANRDAGLVKRHEQRLAQATYTAVEVEALVKTASKLGRELGRREAAEELAAAFDREAELIESLPDDDGVRPQVRDILRARRAAFRDSAHIAREIATKEPTDEPEASRTRCSHCGFYRPSGGGLEHHPKCPHAATKEPK